MRRAHHALVDLDTRDARGISALACVAALPSGGLLWSVCSCVCSRLLGGAELAQCATSFGRPSPHSSAASSSRWRRRTAQSMTSPAQSTTLASVLQAASRSVSGRPHPRADGGGAREPGRHRQPAGVLARAVALENMALSSGRGGLLYARLPTQRRQARRLLHARAAHAAVRRAGGGGPLLQRLGRPRGAARHTQASPSPDPNLT
eukprot:scaffold25980_cov69-Phaeocystis_antarctica.AAC.4